MGFHQDFTENIDFEYQNACAIFDAVADLKSPGAIASHLKRKDIRYPFNISVFLVLAQVSTSFGKLHGIESGETIPSAKHVQIANKHKAMALMGTDTYYIFYEGVWKFWADVELDIDYMTIREYDKELILESLQLSVMQAPLFVSLAGGLYSSEENVKKIVSFFKPWTFKLFVNVAKYVNEQRFPLNEDVIFNIIREITGSNDFQLFEDITKTMKMMDANLETVMSENLSGSMEHFSNDFMSFGVQILENQPIFISPVFTDLRFRS